MFFFCINLGCHNSYLPPEFFMHGIVDEKTDVYAYGYNRKLNNLLKMVFALDDDHWHCVDKMENGNPHLKATHPEALIWHHKLCPISSSFWLNKTIGKHATSTWGSASTSVSVSTLTQTLVLWTVCTYIFASFYLLKI